MPDWAFIRLAASGPRAEMDRFKGECIRPQRESTSPGLDFEALVPAPDPTDIDDDWREENWGTKWNSRQFSELLNQPERYACRFATAWSVPEQIFVALARKYPSLAVEIFAVGEAGHWGYVGASCTGVYHSVEVEHVQRLRFLIFQADAQSCFPIPLSEDPAGLIANMSSVHQDDVDYHAAASRVGQQRIVGAWLAAVSRLPAEQRAHLEFCEDVEGYTAWLESEDRGTSHRQVSTRRRQP